MINKVVPSSIKSTHIRLTQLQAKVIMDKGYEVAVRNVSYNIEPYVVFKCFKDNNKYMGRMFMRSSKMSLDTPFSQWGERSTEMRGYFGFFSKTRQVDSDEQSELINGTLEYTVLDPIGYLLSNTKCLSIGGLNDK